MCESVAVTPQKPVLYNLSSAANGEVLLKMKMILGKLNKARSFESLAHMLEKSAEKNDCGSLLLWIQVKAATVIRQPPSLTTTNPNSPYIPLSLTP